MEISKSAFLRENSLSNKAIWKDLKSFLLAKHAVQLEKSSGTRKICSKMYIPGAMSPRSLELDRKPFFLLLACHLLLFAASMES